MKALEKLILAAGLATIGLLLWRFDAAEVWAAVSGVGAGFLLIIPFQIFDHLLNAVGMRFAFSKQDAPRLGLRRLLEARIAGDAVNYLTPSGSIAGELVRPAILGDAVSAEARNAGVAVAKLAQACGQACFIMLGLVLVVRGRLDFLTPGQRAAAFGAAGLMLAGSAAALSMMASHPAPGTRFWQADGALGPARRRLRRYLADHPGRFALSAAFFGAGYAWGGVEVLLICRFLDVPIPLATAFAVEVLSNVIDSVLFMVPAKAGTQEAGKTAIFHGLGYAASDGLAFGLVRHVRELAWAFAGFALYTRRRRAAALRAS